MKPLPVGGLFAERYQIEAALGHGAMGAVFRARDLALGEVVALKTLGPGHAASPTSALRFRQEAKLARRVTHRNVARVFDIGEHEGTLFLTMELVHGDTLRDVLRTEGPLSLERAVRIGLALCAGLGASHAAGVVHRDLKPANVLIEATTGRVVIADFGIARAVEDDSGLTVGVIGTPNYMSPEQRDAGKLDQRTDIYALGVVLGELFTGARPSRTETFAPVGLPPGLVALVQQALSVDPELRPASAEEVATALAPFAGTLEIDARTIDDAAPRSAERVIERRVARTLAVLPLRYRGPADREDLAEALTDELVDMLSRVKSLRVFAASATQRYKTERDARVVCRELGAYAVVDGAVQLTSAAPGGAEQLRLTARLLDSDGVQLYSEQFSGSVADALTMHERFAVRVAEQLRVELILFAHRGEAPQEAIELYLRARRQIPVLELEGERGAIAALDRALELSPTFGPALSNRAVAAVRAWFFAALSEDQRDRRARATAAVDAALSLAPSEPETHLAAAMLAVQLGDFDAAGSELERALEIAPTYAMALEYLGQLELEAGHVDAGRARLHLAVELNPMSMLAHWTLARHAALERDWVQYEEIVREIRRREARALSPYPLLRVRVAAWRGDRDTLLEMATVRVADNRDVHAFASLYARGVLGVMTTAELDAEVDRLPIASSLRFHCGRDQLVCEVHAAAGDLARASVRLASAADALLIDVSWLELCPALEPLRGTPVFDEAMRKAAQRALALGNRATH